MNFDGLHVVVTGGAGALGSAVVGQLTEAGAVCHIPSRSDRESDNSRVEFHGGIDLTNEDSVQAFYAGLPDIFASIHTAGGFAMAPFSETSKNDFLEQINMNAVTCFLCCREAAGKIRARSVASDGPVGGRIVNVLARPALEPRSGAGMVAYAASKAAVAVLTESLAEELAAENIWVNGVVPSIMDTRVNREAMPNADHASWPKVADIANAIAFLASPENKVTRGALLTVYGSGG